MDFGGLPILKYIGLKYQLSFTSVGLRPWGLISKAWEGRNLFDDNKHHGCKDFQDRFVDVAVVI